MKAPILILSCLLSACWFEISDPEVEHAYWSTSTPQAAICVYRQCPRIKLIATGDWWHDHWYMIINLDPCAATAYICFKLSGRLETYNLVGFEEFDEGDISIPD